MSQWIYDNLGSDVPLHFSAYHPEYRTNQPHTPNKTLIDAWNIAKEVGLDYVFMGNIISNKGSSTKCPSCGTVLIQRSGYNVKNVRLTDQNTCGKCGKKIAIKGNFSKSSRSFF